MSQSKLLVLARAVESEPMRFWMAGTGARDLGSGSTDIVHGASEFYHYYNAFWFSMDHIVLEPEPKNLDAWSWSLKFEFRLHRQF